jgi:hypothetical protein
LSLEKYFVIGDTARKLEAKDKRQKAGMKGL